MSKENTSQKKHRQKYSPQFEDQALERVTKDGVAQVVKDLGLSEAMLYSWRAKQKQGENSLENQKIQQAELARLKREVARLAEENEFLKKAAVDSSSNVRFI